MDKCTRDTEGRAWHSQPTPKARKASKPDVDAAAQGSGKKKKKKDGGKDNLLASAPTAAAASAGGGRGPRDNKHPCQPSDNDEGSQ
jgi:hypothetical protein